MELKLLRNQKPDSCRKIQLLCGSVFPPGNPIPRSLLRDIGFKEPVNFRKRLYTSL